MRYALVLLAGFNESGEHLLKEPAFTSLAETTGAVTIACTFKSAPREQNSIHYAAAGYGSGKALETAVEQITDRFAANLPRNLPFLIYGHSAGGQFAYGYSCYNPERLIGFVSVKGGVYFPEPVRQTYETPGLLISGQRDLERRKKAIRDLFEEHRAHGTPWCWMEEKNSGHEQGESLCLAIPYLKDLLSLRLQENSSGIKKLDLKNSGLWVHLKTGKIIKPDESTFHDDMKQIGWFPSFAVFNQWLNQDSGPEKYD